jgi:predicted amidohydrolase
MLRTIWLMAFATLSLAAPPRFEQSEFVAAPDGIPDGWAVWAARPEVAPRTFVDEVHSLKQRGALAISGSSNAASYGGWEKRLEGIQSGNWYRLAAGYRAEGVNYEPLQVVARLDWVAASGQRAGQPDYAYRVAPESGWKRLVVEAPAPEKAVAVRLQFYLANAPQGVVWWDDLRFEEIPAPSRRPVRVAAINLRPQKTGNAARSVDEFISAVDAAVQPGTDVILLPEGITIVGTGKKYAEVAEPVPGPTTARLAELAKRHRAFLAAGLYEREAPAIYNTAILLDRAGQLIGKYRKVYLPREEIEGGLTPGNDFPVFDTDFGKVGLMICWDVQYADPARALALRGAELLLLPIWGGNETLAKARAIENRLFIATSGYDFPTLILDPDGEVLSVARERGAAAVATLDLNKRYVDPWLGDMRGRFFKELRLDLEAKHPPAYR